VTAAWGLVRRAQLGWSQLRAQLPGRRTLSDSDVELAEAARRRIRRREFERGLFFLTKHALRPAHALLGSLSGGYCGLCWSRDQQMAGTV